MTEFIPLQVTKKEVDAFVRPVIRETNEGFLAGDTVYPSLQSACRAVGDTYVFIPYYR